MRGKEYSVLNNIKAKLSVLVVLSMVLTMVLPHISILSFNAPNLTYAAPSTELVDESSTLPQRDNTSNTTLYNWGAGSSAFSPTPNDGLSFRIKENTTDSYDTNTGGQIVFGDGGSGRSYLYPAYFLKDKNNPSFVQDNTSAGSGIAGVRNGKVITLNNHDDSNQKIEVKFVTSVSPDKKYTLLDMYAQNLYNDTQYFSIRWRADTQLKGNDRSRALINPYDQLVHCVDDNGSSFASFDVISSDSNIKLDPFTVAIGGTYGNLDAAGWNWGYKNKNTSNSDSAISIGWKNLEIKPYELIHKRIAFLARTRTYYVNGIDGDDNRTGSSSAGVIPGTDVQKSGGGRPGAFDYPFRTIEKALQAINNAGAQKAFICLQTPNIDFPDETIDLGNKDITFQTADIDLYGSKIKEVYSFRIASNSQFKIGTSGAVTFQDMKFDGENLERTKPFIVQDGGSVSLSSNTEFKNFINTDGAAIVNTSDSGLLNLYGTIIKDCISKDGYCAVHYSGPDQGFSMNGANIINTNKNVSDKNANIYLDTDKVIQITEALSNISGTTAISVTVSTASMPKKYVGAITSSDQERVLATPAPSYTEASGWAGCPFVGNITSDELSGNDRLSVDAGRTEGNEKSAILKELGNKVTFRFSTDTGSSIPTASRSYMVFGKNEAVSIDTITVYKHTLKQVNIEGTGLVADNDPASATFGRVTGTMGTSDVKVTYVYIPDDSVISFETNGGIPTEIPVVQGKVGRPVNGILATPRKMGYIFKGWFTNNASPSEYVKDKINGLPSIFPNDDTTYYARYAPDPNVWINVSEHHANANNSIIFFDTPETADSRKNVEMAIEYDSIDVPGYIVNQTNSSVDPATYNYGNAEEPVGTFAVGTGGKLHFRGKMPGATTVVSYKYDVDPTVTKKFRKEFYRLDASGNEQAYNIMPGDTNYIEDDYAAEANITYQPPERAGHVVDSATIIAGGTEDPTNHYTKVTGVFDQNNRYKFDGKMPNQNVTIKYVYRSTSQQKEFIINHKDGNTADNRYEHIVNPTNTPKYYEDELSASKLSPLPYGYTYTNGDAVRTPDTVGEFDANDNFTGIMPLNDNVSVTYTYRRNSIYFKEITYKPYSGIANTLSTEGKSPDFRDDFKTDVLIKSGTNHGWKFSEIQNRDLVPDVTVAEPSLYAVNGFFIDKNNNCTYEEGVDVLLTNDYEFDGPATIVPKIDALYRDITISFVSDGNVAYDFSGVRTNYTTLDSWMTVIDSGTLPSDATLDDAGYYYLFDGWYINDVKVNLSDSLVDEGVYVAKFKKDTRNADALKKVAVSATIDEKGNGKINLRDIHTGYFYVLTDPTSGNIIAKQQGTSNSLVFDHENNGVHINKKYNLYEVNNETNDTMATFTNISDIVDPHKSEASLIYVPAVEKNYTVSVDTDSLNSGNKNVAKLEIKPTSYDYQYALYDGDQIVSGTDWLRGKVAGITFEGLEPGKTYKVVTKNANVETTDTGTTVYIDTLYNLTSNLYVVTIINGTMSGNSSAIIEAGQKVDVVASNPDNFAKWVSSGGAVFANVNNAETSFTMPTKNVIILAKEKVPENEKIKLTNTSYGSSDYVIQMDNAKEEDMINELATAAERYLSNHDFSIRYNVVYNKEVLTVEEQAALENASGPATGIAARGAIAINVDVDRYIDNRRVDDDTFIDPPVALTSGEGFMGIGTNDLNALFGSELIKKVEGLEDYLNSEKPTVEKETETEETTEYETEPEDESTVNETTDETTTIDNKETETTESITSIETEETTTKAVETEETTTKTVETEETTTKTVETEETTTKEAETEETTTKAEETEETTTKAEETEETTTKTVETEETVSGFSSGTLKLKEEKSNINYDELIENLMLFGSNFANEIHIDTYVLLPSIDTNNGDYVVYESDGTNLTLVPSIFENADEFGRKGVIAFTATKGKRYIIAYNRYNSLVFINDTPGYEGETKKEFRLKYGEALSDEQKAEIPDISNDYVYERATYQNGEWSYKHYTKVPYNIDDTVITPLNIYAVYDSDAEDISVLLDAANAALERARKVLDNYFLLSDEQTDIRKKYNTLLNYIQDENSTKTQITEAVKELDVTLDDIEPKLEVREIEYKKQDNNKNTPNSNNSGSYRPSTGGGGGGGGRGSGGGALPANLPGAAAVDPLSPFAANVNQNPALNNVMTNIVNVPSVVTSKAGMTKVSFNESISAFVKPDGSLAKSEWIDTNYGWYHANSTGTLDAGWNKFGNDWYYFEETNTNNGKNIMRTGLIQSMVNNQLNTYYMSPNGNMLVGYQSINGQTYYFDPIDGSMAVNKTLPDGRTVGADGIVR